MFSKLRTGRYLRTQTSGDAAVVAFVSRVQRIARVHQIGLQDRPTPRGRLVRYPQRELLGITPADRDAIEAILLAHLSQ